MNDFVPKSVERARAERDEHEMLDAAEMPHEFEDQQKAAQERHGQPTFVVDLASSFKDVTVVFVPRLKDVEEQFARLVKSMASLIRATVVWDGRKVKGIHRNARRRRKRARR